MGPAIAEALEFSETFIANAKSGKALPVFPNEEI